MIDKPESAMLRVKWHQSKTEDIKFKFNPTEWSFDKAVQIAEVNIPGLDTPLLQFVRGQNEKIVLDIFCDSTEDGLGANAVSVTEQSDRIYQLVKIEPTRHAPPICTLIWNSKFPGCDTSAQIGGNQKRTSFTCIVESVRHRYTMFSSKGVPLRATLTVTLREYKTLQTQLEQLNLSSPDRTHAHALDRGETLSALAGRYYQRPNAWRAIADLAKNGIEDPRRLEVGRILAIPPLT